MTARSRFAAGAALCGLAVALGAAAAHGPLVPRDAYAQSLFETAHRYHVMHGLALLAVGLVGPADLGRGRAVRHLLDATGFFFVLGTVLFSGLLYGRAVFDVVLPGPFLPMGGFLLILGWVLLFVAAVIGVARGPAPQ